jgi:hypothetical protein
MQKYKAKNKKGGLLVMNTWYWPQRQDLGCGGLPIGKKWLHDADWCCVA